MMILGFLIEKEFKQIARNSFLPKLIFVLPVVMMLIMPFAANMEVRDIKVVVVDADHSALSARLTNKIASSDYFRLVGTANTYPEALEKIELGSADVIVEIPLNFEHTVLGDGTSTVLVAANAVNGTKGALGSSYLSSIVQEFAAQIATEKGTVTANTPIIKISPIERYNPTMDYKVFMVPALMVMLLTIMCGFLPALNIVGEKESGTIEQINVTPVSRYTFIIGKLIPYWIVGYVVLSLSFLVAFLVYGLVPIGSIVSLYIASTLFVLTVSGLGLIISNNSATMQQAMFVMFFFVLILILLSGLFTPIGSMPEWAQNITRFNPLKYFIQIMRSIYLKGSTLSECSTQLFALGCFALALNTWAVISYRKR